LHVPPVLEQLGWRLTILAVDMRAPSYTRQDGSVLGVAFGRHRESDHSYGFVPGRAVQGHGVEGAKTCRSTNGIVAVGRQSSQAAIRVGHYTAERATRARHRLKRAMIFCKDVKW
jgi:hypothetical protein